MRDIFKALALSCLVLTTSTFASERCSQNLSDYDSYLSGKSIYLPQLEESCFADELKLSDKYLELFLTKEKSINSKFSNLIIEIEKVEKDLSLKLSTLEEQIRKELLSALLDQHGKQVFFQRFMSSSQKLEAEIRKYENTVFNLSVLINSMNEIDQIESGRGVLSTKYKAFTDLNTKIKLLNIDLEDQVRSLKTLKNKTSTIWSLLN